MLVLDSEPGNYAQPNPGSRRCAVNNSAEQVNRARPKQRLINIGRIKVADGEEKQAPEHARTCESNRPRTAAQLPREKSGENDGKRVCQRRKNPQREQ